MKRLLSHSKMIFKLLAAPMIVVFFLLSLSCVSYWGFTKEKAALDDIYHNRFKGYQVSSKIQNLLSNVHSNMYKVISWASANYEAKKVEELAKGQAAAIDQAVGLTKGIMGSGMLNAEEVKLYQLVLARLIDYQKQALGVLDIYVSDLNIATMYMGSADDQYQVLDKQLR
jgi:methyl-accepting chemotaxis protein